MTRTESPPPDAASLTSTAAKATGSRRREVDAEDVERERDEEATDELFHETDMVRGEGKRVHGSGAEATPAAAAAVASSMAAA